MRTIKQWYQDLNLQSKFTLVLLVIVAIPAIAIIFFFYGNAYDMVVSYTIRQEQDRSAQTAPLIEESLQKILDVSTEISSLDFYQTLFKNAITDSFLDLAESEDAADFSDRIRQLTQDTPVTNVKIYMEVPKEASADVDAFLNSDHLKDTFLSLEQAKGTYWYGIFRGTRAAQLFCPSFYLGALEKKAYGDQAYITHASVIYDSGTYDAYIAVYYSGYDFNQILSENLTLDGSVSYIMNERNNLVSASSDSLAGIYWLDYDKIMESYMSSNSYVEQEILGKTVYVGFYRIRQPGWFMVTVLPSQPLITQSNILVLQFLAIYIAVLALAFFLASTLSKSITGRISSVISQMRTVRHGPPVPMDSPDAHDEIGDLIDTYNYMTRKMNQLMEKQAQAAEDLRIAEFNSLQAQINPHFLYNTLDLINWISMDYGAEEIGTLTWNLARFYRLSLNHGKSLITIGEEVEHVQVYVNIENYHFDNQISLNVDVTEELKGFACLNIILQPFVENAIVHGIAEYSEIESCSIAIRARKEEEDIIFTIQDDGPGVNVEQMQKETEQDIKKARHGYGVRNINFRLKLCFGEKYGVTYKESEKGTCVEVKIPAMTMEEAEEKI